MFFPPIPLIRREHILEKLEAAKAVSPETAITFADAGVINPYSFRRITRVLVRRGTLGKTEDDRYYIR